MADKRTPQNSNDDVGEPSPRKTIVGGRPPEDGAELPPVPVGLQSLLRLASVDSSFCDELIHRRAEMAELAGVELTASERAILGAIPDEQLKGLASGLPAPELNRRRFLRQSARAAVLLLGGAAMPELACTSEKPPVRNETRKMESEGGAAPHEPPEPVPPPNTASDAADTATEGATAPEPEDTSPDASPAPVDGATHPPQRPMGGGGGARPDLPIEPAASRNETRPNDFAGGAAPDIPAEKVGDESGPEPDVTEDSGSGPT